ncbi:hypothetical protein ABK040_010645 [Willaertia magna]
MEEINLVYNFWFGKEQTTNNKLWFGVGLTSEEKKLLDQEIKQKFEKFTLTRRDELNKLWNNTQNNKEEEEMNEMIKQSPWYNTLRGLLCSIIVLDQFPRNMYRGTKESFDFDSYSLRLTKQILRDQDLYNQYNIFEKCFILLPLEHSENLQDQKEAILRYEELVNLKDNHEIEFSKGMLNFAKLHYDLIEKFGRFPHRNLILGRESTKEELECKISFI